MRMGPWWISRVQSYLSSSARCSQTARSALRFWKRFIDDIYSSETLAYAAGLNL